jgi:hypothetical protein
MTPYVWISPASTLLLLLLIQFWFKSELQMLIHKLLITIMESFLLSFK